VVTPLESFAHTAEISQELKGLATVQKRSDKRKYSFYLTKGPV